MPIRPENAALYPKNWKSEVVPRIRARSGNRCECNGQCGRSHLPEWGSSRCGLVNGQVGGRDSRGDWQEAPHLDDVDRLVTIVLTVAHINHQPEDCRDENLLHMCQGCHNRYDMPMRRAGIQARTRAARAVGDLFQCVETKGATL